MTNDTDTEAMDFLRRLLLTDVKVLQSIDEGKLTALEGNKRMVRARQQLIAVIERHYLPRIYEKRKRWRRRIHADANEK